MAETILLQVQGEVPERLLKDIYGKINPVYIIDLLSKNGMPTDEDTISAVTNSYVNGFPTTDPALKVLPYDGGRIFFGIASGDTCRPERMSVKYLILDMIQTRLAEAGIKSELNIADLNSDTVEYMDKRGIFKGKLPELERIASERGSFEGVALGAVAAYNTPVE